METPAPTTELRANADRAEKPISSGHIDESESRAIRRRGLLRVGALVTAATGASTYASLNLGVGPTLAAPGDKNPGMSYVPTAEKGAASGVATLDNAAKIPVLQIPDLSTAYSPTDGASSINRRGLSLNAPSFDGNFVFSKISNNQDGLIAVKDLNVTGGFGGQVGQGGAISYFKAIGIAAHHSGPGNYDHFWGSVYHDGTREAGLFIGDLTGRKGGNVYGGHFRVQSEVTAPSYLVGLALEILPNVAKAMKSLGVLAGTIKAGSSIGIVDLTASVQFTSGTNLSFTAADGTTVVAYVSKSMDTPSTSVPVIPFTTSSPIYLGTTVVMGVDSTYLGLDIQHNGSQSASAAVSVSHHGSASVPYAFGLNFDATASSTGGTAIMVGGAWGAGLNMNANSIVQVGSIAGTGALPNRDVRIADNLLIDNSRHIKFKDASGIPQKAIGATSTNNMRLKLIGAGTQFEFYDEAERTLLGRITSSGRAEFSAGGLTTRYTASATQPAHLIDGQIEVWHNTMTNLDYLVVNVNGVSKKVVLE